MRVTTSQLIIADLTSPVLDTSTNGDIRLQCRHQVTSLPVGHHHSHHVTSNDPVERRSLRAFLEILWLQPRVHIILRYGYHFYHMNSLPLI
jgi:hypothetical protein